MPLSRLEWAPGINAQLTQTKNKAGWFACNLIRWRNGLLEKIAGWQRLFATPCAGIVRFMHAYLDLLNDNNLLIGTDAGAQLFVNGTLYNFTFKRRVAEPGAMVTVIGLPTVTVTDNGHGAITGDTIATLVTYSAGGIIILGGTSFVVTVINANTYTFTMPSNATSVNVFAPHLTVTIAGVNPNDPLSGTITVSVNLPSHGLIVGNSFIFQAATLYSVGISGSFSVPAGTATVASVTDANNFVITAGFASFTVTANSTTTLYEGYNSGTPAAVGSPYAGGQYGVIQYFNAAPPTPENWFIDNLGNNGLVNFTNGAIYSYTPPAPVGSNPVLVGLGNGTPQLNSGMFVAMPQAQVIAFGSEVALGGGVQDPLLIRFSDAGSLTSWTASATNQAGSFRLGGNGSRIVGGLQVAQTLLIWTDADVWLMNYEGPPFVYGFTTLASGCGLVAPHAVAQIGRTVIWLSTKSFFAFSDGGISPVVCPVWDIIFNDLDTDNQSKCFAGTSTSTHELWFFYPSLADGTGECSRYVKVNIAENLWDYGAINRSAWIGESVFGAPLGADNVSKRIQQHETGYDDDDQAMSGVYAESGYADISDGDTIMLVNEFIPDMKWFGTNGAIKLTLRGANYPGETAKTKGPFGMDSTNRHIRPRLRARQIALRIDWLDRAGFSARLGTPRIRVSPAGRRP